MGSDTELLSRYAGGEQDAFTEIVRRYLNLVFSAARRQTGSPEMAEDVAQAVFTYLARNVANIKPDTPLVAWLHLTTRHLALNAVRSESRRRAREQSVYELSAMNASSSAWTQLEPLLDEAVAALPDADRNAILVRYFEGRSLRAIGSDLGISDDAAQKRVTRAVDRLRAFFLKRGVTVSSAALAADLSARAIEIAPASLGAAIAAGTALSTAVTFHAAGSLAMTTTQKISVAAVLLVIAGAISTETHVLAGQKRDIQALEKTSVDLGNQLVSIRRDRNAARAGATPSAALPAAPGIDPAAVALMRTVAELRRRLDERPGQKIPEMELLVDADWLDVASRAEALDTDTGLAKAFSALRQAAKSHISQVIEGAYMSFVRNNDQNLPSEISQLIPYLKTPIDPAVLQRYEILRTGPIAAVPVGATVYGEIAPVDQQEDTLLTIVRIDAFPWVRRRSDQVADLRRSLQGAIERFAKLNPGEAVDGAKLLPFYEGAPNPNADDIQRNLGRLEFRR